MAFSPAAQATKSYVDGGRIASDYVTEVHNIPITWARSAAPAVSVGTCTATLKKAGRFWSLEMPAFQLSGITTAGSYILGTYTDTKLLFGAAATVWDAFSNIVDLANWGAAGASQGVFKITHAAGVVTITSDMNIDNTTKAFSAYSQTALAPGDMHSYNVAIFPIDPTAV